MKQVEEKLPLHWGIGGMENSCSMPLIAIVHVLLMLCCFPNPKRKQIQDSCLPVKLGCLWGKPICWCLFLEDWKAMWQLVLYQWCVIPDVFPEDICDSPLENGLEFDEGEKLFVLLSEWMSLQKMLHMFLWCWLLWRQRRWLEFLKDYDFGMNYHLDKVNVVVDALTKKSLHMS